MSGADDTGDDIEIGESNQADLGTSLVLVPTEADQSLLSDFVLSVDVVQGPGLKAVNGIVSRGIAGGSGVVGTSDTLGGPGVLGIGTAAAAGVMGTNAFGTGVSGISTDPSGSGVGVSGISDKGFGVLGNSAHGVGVDGVSSIGVGVHGISSSGDGVFGRSLLAGTGVVAESGSGIGVRARTGTGVAVFASSTHERGGVFLSGSVPFEASPGIRTSQEGIAQVRLVPSSSPKLPTKGSMGDLFAHVVVSPNPTAPPVNLFLCVSDNPVQWQQVQLAPKIYPGGSNAP
jgi:hypothetical protein